VWVGDELIVHMELWYNPTDRGKMDEALAQSY